MAPRSYRAWSFCKDQKPDSLTQNLWRDEIGASARAVPDLGKIKLVAITK